MIATRLFIRAIHILLGLTMEVPRAVATDPVTVGGQPNSHGDGMTHPAVALTTTWLPIQAHPGPTTAVPQ
jgi:hypothetical protein